MMMKNTLITLLVLFFTSISFAQDFKIDKKTVIGVFEFEDKSKPEIFASANKWIAINYYSANDVIQMNDSVSGILIVKGINEISYKNPWLVVHPKNPYVLQNITNKFYHILEVNVKDNRMRIIYKITDLVDKDIVYNNLFFNVINLNGSEESDIQAYNNNQDNFLKIKKAKKAKYNVAKDIAFNSINTLLVNDIKLTILSIAKAVSSNIKDDW